MYLLEPGFIVVLVTVLVVGVVVVFHYEVTHLLSRWHPRRLRKPNGKMSSRPALLATMFILLFAHVVEIWLFGAVLWWLVSQDGYGAISGYSSINLLDCVYFSASAYTTVGWGDVVATGHIRFLAGTEALVGFMMITWSASFSYLMMARTWGQGEE